jgi:transcriptional regulator with XRE-family HTH domain
MLRIKEICKEKGITLQDLSERLGINYQSLHSAMTGNPKLETLLNIAEKLDVPITELFEEKKEVHILIEYKGETKRITENDLIEIFDKK